MRPFCRLLVVAVVLSGGVTGCSPPAESAPDPQDAPLKPLFKEKVARKRTDGDGAKGGGSVEQDAMVRALDKSREEFKTQYATLHADSAPADVAKAFGAYAKVIEDHDLKGCPVEFKSAWVKHVRSWQKFVAAVKAQPAIYDDVEFMEMVQHLFAGNPEKAKALGGDVTTAGRKVTASRNAVYSVAEGAGVVVKDSSE